MLGLSSKELSAKLVQVRDNLSSFQLSGDGDRVEAVVAILLWDDGATGLQTLLVHRAERDGDPWSGQIGLPGGRVKPSDASPRSALHREVEEEVGVELDGVGVELGRLSIGQPMRRTELRVQPWVYGLKVKPKISLGSEIAGSFWANLHELTSKRAMSDVTVRDRTWSVESFVIDGQIVWGFTHRVLSELIPILGTPY